MLLFNLVVHAQLHHFSDASSQAYGAASYLRLMDESQNIYCILVFAKSRLVPVKAMTIPRLELSAATISVQLDKVLKEELQLSNLCQNSTFWTDSTTVLRYLNNKDKAFHTFIANRVQTIKDASEMSQWKHVSTNQNPADDVSRGLLIPEFLRCSRWKDGPEFLWKPESEWPIQPEFLQQFSDDDPEVKKPKIKCFAASCIQSHFLETLIRRYSSWHKLIRVCAWVMWYLSWTISRGIHGFWLVYYKPIVTKKGLCEALNYKPNIL